MSNPWRWITLLALLFALGVAPAEENCPELAHGLTGQLTEMCKTVMATKLCAEFSRRYPKDAVTCDAAAPSKPSLFDYFRSCGEGAVAHFKAAWEILRALVDAAMGDRSQLARASAETQAFVRSAGAYLVADYERAYSQSASPARHLKAVQAVSGTLMKALVGTLEESVKEQVAESVCMNTQARTREICQQLSLVVAGGGALLIAKLAKRLPSSGELRKVSSRLAQEASVGPKAMKVEERATSPAMDEILYRHSRASDSDRVRMVESATIYKRYKNDPEFAAWADDYLAKNPGLTAGEAISELQQKYPGPGHGVKPNHSVLDLSDPSLSNRTEIPSPTYFAGDMHTTSAYQKLVPRLRAGDEIVGESKDLGERHFKIGKMIGAGNTTHIYEIDGSPNQVLRLPFAANNTGDGVNIGLSNKRLVEDRHKYTDIPGLNVVGIHDHGKNFEYIVVDRLPPSKSGEEWLDRYFELQAKVEKNKKLSLDEQAEYEKIEGWTDKMADMAERVARASGHSERVKNLEEDFQSAARSELRQIHITDSGEFFLADWE